MSGEERYRVVPATDQALSYVEHLDAFTAARSVFTVSRSPSMLPSDAKGAWCGPLIPASDHPRADELRDVDVICEACGDFCRDAPAAIVRKVKRLHAAWLRFERESEAFAVNCAKLRAAGIDTSKMVYRPRAPRRRARVRQLQLFK